MRLPLWLSFLIASVSPAGAAPPAIDFDAEYFVTSTGGSYGRDIVAGDWNEDGLDDLAVADANGSLVVLLGVGHHRLRALAPLSLPDALHSLDVGDFDADGTRDLLVGGDSRTFLLLGDGNGGFALEREIPFEGLSVAVGRLDGDSHPDLVLAGRNRVRLVSLQGTTVAAVDSVADWMAAFAAGDLDGDQDIDFVADDMPGARVWINQGDGTFELTPYAGAAGCPVRPEYLALGDFNGDGHRDVVGGTSNPYNGCGLYLAGRGDGTFFVPGSTTTSAGGERGHEVQHVPPGPHFITLANLDGDPQDEIIDLTWELGDEVMGRRSPGGSVATTADLDGDGRLDVAVLGGDIVTVHPTMPDGTLRSRWVSSIGDEPYSSWLHDLDGDGSSDLLVRGEGGVWALRGTSTGGFARYHPGAPLEPPLDVADYDRDGRADVLTGFGWHRGRGDGTFETHPTISLLPQTPQAWVSGDLDRDGDVDVIAVESARLSVWVNHGDGTFDAGPVWDETSRNVRLADFDGDGHLDLAIAATTHGSVRHGNGDGSFTDPVTLLAEDIFEIVTGDLDGDGHPDLVTRSSSPPVAFLTRGRGFEAVVGGVPKSPQALGDFDGDGFADLIAGGHVARGLGNGRFEKVDRVGPGGLVHLDDRNHDGRPDLVILRRDNEHGDENSVSVIHNLTPSGSTPTLLALLSSRVRGGDVELVWRTSDRSGARGTVSRTVDGHTWTALAEVAFDGTGTARFEERGLAPGRYGYRISHDGMSGAPHSAVTWVDVRGEALRLDPVRPQPSAGAVAIAFTLARPGAVEVDVVDVLGRRTASHRWNGLPAGPHVRPLDLTLPPGVYTIVLRQNSERRATRVVVAP
jgi:hypothetical protein